MSWVLNNVYTHVRLRHNDLPVCRTDIFKIGTVRKLMIWHRISVWFSLTPSQGSAL
jgi:hypothetical protein